MSVIQSSSSVSHTYGNVACAIMNYVQSYFDEDFFKTRRVPFFLRVAQFVFEFPLEQVLRVIDA